jgi:glycosyltransferase involved in cell wall biosynthesis
MTGACSISSESIDIFEDMSHLAAHPVVSVAMITYNHEPYIRQALDGVLMQEVRFSYELVIGEDKSTDRTREIVLEYQRRHPDKIRLRLARENIYSKGVNPYFSVLAACRGQYIAFLEGDDYWTDPRKLQKQVNFLEANAEYVMCFHNAEVVNYHLSKVESFICPGAMGTFEFTTSDVLRRGWFYPTASLVFRNVGNMNVPEWVLSSSSGDIALVLWLSLHGKIKMLADVMSVYRRHPAGISLAADHQGYKKLANILFLFESFNRDTNRKYDADVLAGIIHELHEQVPFGWRDAVDNKLVNRSVNYAVKELLNTDSLPEKRALCRELYERDPFFADIVLREYYRHVCWQVPDQKILQALILIITHLPSYCFSKCFVGATLGGARAYLLRHSAWR